MPSDVRWVLSFRGMETAGGHDVDLNAAERTRPPIRRPPSASVAAPPPPPSGAARPIHPRTAGGLFGSSSPTFPEEDSGSRNPSCQLSSPVAQTVSYFE